MSHQNSHHLFLLYNRDIVLLVDNLLKPRRKYLGENYHQIALQEQHRPFVFVRNHLKKAAKKQGKYADMETKTVEFEVGDSAFYKNNQTKSKLDLKWKPYYRIIEMKGSVSYLIKNQLDGSTCKVYAEMLRLDHVDEWQISNFFFFFFFIWVLRPFQEYFTYIQPIVHRRWAKTGEPGEKPPDHP